MQTIRISKNKENIYSKENKITVACCFRCLWLEFIKDKSNKKYSTISYVSFLRRLPKNIVLPSKKTDLFELCLAAKRVSFKEENTEEEIF